MIRSLWTLVKIGIVVSLVVWVAERPGTITIDWMPYRFTVHVGFAFLVVIGIVVLGIILFSIIKTLLDMPKTMSRYRDITYKDKGLRALTIGMAAVAAGDAKAASYQASRAKKFLESDNALSMLLEAQAARLDGRESDAARSFIELMDNSDASFLGVRGLLQSALDGDDYDGALEFAYKALKSQPKQSWVLKLIYDLEIRSYNWDKARNILVRAEKAGAIPADKANRDRIAMFLAESDLAKENGDNSLYASSLKKAHKLGAGFVPCVERLAHMYQEKGKHSSAVSVVEKAWKIEPHPELVTLWAELYVAPKSLDSSARIRWFERLLALNPNSALGLQALASALIDEALWGVARENLCRAAEIEESHELYVLWAHLEESATHDEKAVADLLAKADEFPSSRMWLCSETGRIYDKWLPISDQGMFNTIIWGLPQGNITKPVLLS